MALGWLWWRAWFPGGAVTPWRFAWQAWHFVTSTFTLCGRWHLMTWIVTLRGRRGTYGTGLALVARLVPSRRCDTAAFCVARMALCTTCSHTQLTHTQLPHIQLAHIQLSHTQLAHIQLAHTQLTHTQLTHTQLAHTHNLLTHNSFCVAGVALCDIHVHFVWQACHLTAWIVALRGRRGTL